MTKIIRTVLEMRLLRMQIGGQIGFVPTMGALHKGHLKLIEQSKSENKTTVVSIFVNPTQFNNKKDFDTYPVSFDSDFEMLEQAGVDYLFYPNYVDLFPDNFNYKVNETEFSKTLCGAFRPGHFTGVLTVVMKLFNIVGPHKAYFGEKDYQQYLLIKEMAKSFFMDVDVIGVQTVRDNKGLALSSRNIRLSEDGKKIATNFASVLQSKKSKNDIKNELINLGIDIEYLEEIHNRRFAAVNIEGVRLIDNVEI